MSSFLLDRGPQRGKERLTRSGPPQTAVSGADCHLQTGTGGLVRTGKVTTMATNDERSEDSPASASSAAGFTTLVDVLAQLHEAGWTADLRTESEGRVR